MRNHRVALITAICLAALSAVMYPALASPDPKEAPASWKSSLAVASPLPSQLLSNQSLQPLAVFATAVTAAQENQAAAAFAAAARSLEASSSPTPTASGPSAPAATSTPTGACGAEDSISPGPASKAEAAGVPCAWVPTAVCEESGNDDPYAGYFGILEWNGFGGYPAAGQAPLDVQLGWESAHGQGPPDAPGQCHSY